jgi:hypothetical protein
MLGLLHRRPSNSGKVAVGCLTRSREGVCDARDGHSPPITDGVTHFFDTDGVRVTKGAGSVP